MATVADPLAALRFLATARGVVRTRSGAFAGTIDLTRLDPHMSVPTRLVAGQLLKRTKGASPEAVPFTATVADQGHLTSVKATFPRADHGKDLAYELTLSDFGTADPVARPAGSTVMEAPAALYTSLNART